MGPCGRVSVGRSDFRVKSLGLCCPLAYSQLAGVLLPGWWLRHDGVADSPDVWSRGGGVEMWCGGLGSAYLLPALSLAGASLALISRCQHTSCSITWAAKQEKTPAVAEVFFLDFSFYRTDQD